MQYRFFRQTEGAACTGLVLHFNGWAMPPEAVQHLRLPHGYDLLVLWDYRTDALDPLELGQYEQIHLTAWSMGVWAADRFLGAHPELRERIGSATAIAGTGYPVNDLLGIPRAHCEQTLSELTEENRPRFNRRTCGGKSLRHLFEALAARPTEELRAEMLRPYHESLLTPQPSPKVEALGLWTRAYVGARDRILPLENQLRYWRGQGLEPILLPEGEHYLLKLFTHWQELWE